MASEWETKTIKVLYHVPGKGDSFRRVWALVKGDIAIHPVLAWYGVRRHVYNVTHVPTGTKFGNWCKSKEAVLKTVEKLDGLMWRNIRIASMPVCEFTTNYELIIDEAQESIYGHDINDIRNKDYERMLKDSIALAHGCQ